MDAAPGVILLVDDNLDDIDLTRHAFTGAGITHPITTAHDGLQALALLIPTDGQAPLRPVIILTDINMPHMGGIELLARLHANPLTTHLPVIMLTASDAERHEADSNDFGACGYLSKPVIGEGFLQVARMLGVHWLGLTSRPPAT